MKKNGPTSVSEFVCVCARCPETDKPIDMSSGGTDSRRSKEHVFDADSGLLTGNWHFWQGACKLYGLCKSVGGDAALSKLLWTLVSLVSACRLGLEVPGG